MFFFKSYPNSGFATFLQWDNEDDCLWSDPESETDASILYLCKNLGRLCVVLTDLDSGDYLESLN